MATDIIYGALGIVVLVFVYAMSIAFIYLHASNIYYKAAEMYLHGEKVQADAVKDHGDRVTHLADRMAFWDRNNRVIK